MSHRSHFCKIWFLLVFFKLIACRNKNVTYNRFGGVEIREYDPILVTRCDLHCLESPKPIPQNCHQDCLRENMVKPGSCPMSFVDLPVFISACIHSCSEDRQCNGVDKCCQHSCGRTCQPAINLNTLKYLPPVPFNVTLTERKGKKVVQVSWKVNKTMDYQERMILYVIEERHHSGRHYNKDRLGKWTPVHQAKKTPVILRDVLRSGKWYEVRVAAVSKAGTQGYSNISPAFNPTPMPSKPSKPRKLKVVHVRKVNSTVWGEFRWSPGKSELPIQKYKIYWSRRLEEIRPSNDSGPIHVGRQVVSADRRRHQIRNLEKDTLYFIQIQAVSYYGKKRLPGEMEAMIFNTSRFEDQIGEKHVLKRY